MLLEGGRPVRGTRPSRCGMPEEENEEAEIVRLSNIILYARRASLGLPIFDETDASVGKNRTSLRLT